jgi:hypothetical protein
MARSRNIKPGFFKNYVLADAGPQVQLLFAGLWCLADRDGRLEDKPRFIKAELFPYYDFDVNGGLTELERLKFICRYRVDDMAIIQVLNFQKHQSPHKTEKASALPTMEFSAKESNSKTGSCVDNGEHTVISPLENDGNPPDSLLLIPDSLIPEKKESKPVDPEKQLSETDMLKNAGIDWQLSKDFLKIRKAKKAPLTQTALDGLEREAALAGISVEDAVRICVERNWQGFKADWLNNSKTSTSNQPTGISRDEWNSTDF